MPGTPGGIAASGPRPGLILGCGPSRPASRHPERVIKNGFVSCVSSGQHHSAGFPRPSHTGACPAVPLRHWWPVPFRPAISVPCVQGVSAINTKHTNQTRGPHAATRSTHSTAPSALHCTDRQHLRCTAAQPLGLRPPAPARLEAGCVLPGVSGTLCCRRSSIRSVTAEAHGQSCGLRASTALLPEYRHPKEPAPPTVCVSETSSGGPAAFTDSLSFPLRHLPDKVRLIYGGATFEYKTCYVVNNITSLMLPKQLCCVKDVTSCK